MNATSTLTGFLLRARLRTLALAVGVLLPSLSLAQVQAKMADGDLNSGAFMDRVGINAALSRDLPENETASGNDADFQTLRTSLKDLGIRHIRTGIDLQGVRAIDSRVVARIRTIGGDGVKCVVPMREFASFSDYINTIAGLGSAIAAVEGPNEANLGDENFSYNGERFPNGTRNYQRDLYRAFKADSRVSSLPVYLTTVAPTDAYGSLGNMETYGGSKNMDYGNLHAYNVTSHIPGNTVYDYHIANARKAAPSLPLVATEGGYDLANVSELTRSKYYLRMWCDAMAFDIKRMYLWQLKDGGASTGFGLLDGSNNKRGTYHAVKNFIGLIKDPGGNFTPSSLNYTLSGSSGNVRSVLLQKRNGAFLLLVWNDVVSYDGGELNPAAAARTLSIGSSGASVKIYAPVTNGTAATTNFGNPSNPSSITLSVPDHPLIIEITPSGTGTPTLRTPENPASTLAGLDYRYYEGTWDALPTFGGLTAAKTGTASTFSATTNRNRADNYAFRYTGYVQVPTDGTYTFYTTSDDGSKLYIGSTLVVSNDGLHGPQERSGTVGLKAGKHALTVEYFEKGGGEALSVSYAGPSLSKQAVPTTALFRVDASAPVLANGLYTLTSKVSVGGAPRRVLDVSGGVDQNGQNVQLWEALGNAAQQWYFESTADGFYKITSQVGGKTRVLDAANGGRGNNSNVMIWTDGNGPNQRWKVESDGNGYYFLTTQASAGETTPYRLDLYGGANANGTNVAIWEPYDNDHQRWKIEAVPASAARTAQAALAATAAPDARGLHVYPNPNRGQGTLALETKEAQHVTVYVHDAQGHLTSVLSVPARAGRTDFPLPATLAPGTYHVRATVDGQAQRFTLRVE